MSTPLRRWVIALTICLLGSAALAAPQKSERDLFRQIKDQGDKVNSAVFESLGARKNAKALDALSKGVDELRSATKLEAAFKAFRHFRGVEDLESKAIAFVAKMTGDAQKPVKHAAAKGLQHFGTAASDTVERLLKTHRDAEVRALVLKPLVPELKKRGDASSLRVLLDNYRIPQSGSRTQLMEACRAISSSDTWSVYKAFMKDKHSSPAMKQTVIEALAQIENDGVDEVLLAALKGKNTIVQYAALEALRTRGKTDHVGILTKFIKSKDAAVRRAALIALARIRGGELEWVEEMFKYAESKDPVLRQGAAVALGELRTTEAVNLLFRLLRDPAIAVRIEALQCVGNLRTKDSIPFLIDRLNAENGRLRGDVVTCLRLVTGEDHGTKPQRWRNWWQAEGSLDAYQVPAYNVAMAKERQRERRKDEAITKTSFYGLKVVSDRVAFVLDVSGSMSGGAAGGDRLTVAKKQLSAALESFPDGDLFNVIFFSTDIFPWQDDLTVMNNKARREVLSFIDRQKPNGGTAIYDGLIAAFEDERIDTIYLLSDGSATAGKIIDAGELRAEIKRMNSARKVKINCIAIGGNHPLLKGLAADSGGDYRHVK